MPAVYLALGRPKLIMQITTVTSILRIGLLAYGAIHGGVIGVAWAMVASSAVSYLINVCFYLCTTIGTKPAFAGFSHVANLSRNCGYGHYGTDLSNRMVASTHFECIHAAGTLFIRLSGYHHLRYRDTDFVDGIRKIRVRYPPGLLNYPG